MMFAQCILLAGGITAAAPHIMKSPLLTPNTTAIASSSLPSLTETPNARPALMWDILDRCQRYLPPWESAVSKTCSARDEDVSHAADDAKCLLAEIDDYAMVECKMDQNCAHNRVFLEVNSLMGGLQACSMATMSANHSDDPSVTPQSSSQVLSGPSQATVDLTSQLVSQDASGSRDLDQANSPQPLALQTCLYGCNMDDADCQVSCLDPQLARTIQEVAAMMRRPGSQVVPAPSWEIGTPLAPVATLLTSPPSATESMLNVLMDPKPEDAVDKNDEKSLAAVLRLSSSISTIAAALSSLAFLL